MERRSLMIFLILFELLYIPIAAGRPYNDQSFGYQIPMAPAINFPDMTGRQFTFPDNYSPTNFSDVLFRNLAENGKFRNIFSRPINGDQVLKLGLSICQALSTQVSISDRYAATNQMLNAFNSVNPSAGHEAFARAIVNATTQILESNGLLNAGNSLFFANSLTPAIINAAASVFGNVDVDVAVNTGLSSGRGLTTHVGTPLNINSKNLLGVEKTESIKAESDIDSVLNDINDLNIDIDSLFDDVDLNIDTDINAGLDVGVALDTNLGLNANFDNVNGGVVIDNRAGVGTKFGTNVGLGAKTSLGSNFNTRPGLSVGSRTGVDLGTKTNFGLGTDIRAGVGAKIGAGIDLDTKSGLDLGIDTRTVSKTKSGVGVDLGVKSGVGLDIDTGVSTSTRFGGDVDLNAGVNAGISASLDAGSLLDIGLSAGNDVDIALQTEITPEFINSFKILLTKELLGDKYFRYIFSEYVPIPVLNLITASISQYLSKAFTVPPSVFLPLEKNVLTLSINKTLTLESYADIIAITISKILSDLKIIAPAVAQLQITMAANAISSGISTFLDVYTTPGSRLSITSNSYNSFFSVLSGLDKLPYVGGDVLSRKLPPILKTAKASSSALRFFNQLYNNLISSRRFYESFSLGVPASAYKIISNSLGKFVAEAFGSPSYSFFADIYTNALLKTIGILSYKTYAKVLSLATMRALYSLGFFLSGNIHIQAAIATNAILRALKSQSVQSPVITQVAFLPKEYGLSWTTPVTGVSPSDSLLQVSSAAGVNAGVEIGADIAGGSVLGLRTGKGLDTILGVGKGIGLGLGADIGIDANAGVGSAAELGLDAGLDASVKVDNGLGLDLDADLLTDIDVGLDLDPGVAVDLDLNADKNKEDCSHGELCFRLRKKRSILNLELNDKMESDTSDRQKRYSLLDIDVDAPLGLKADLGAKVDLGAKTDLGAKVKSSVNPKIDVDADIGANAGKGIGINTKLDIGLEGNSDESTASAKLTVLNLLPKILADKLYHSTALYTSVSMVGSRKVINLIAQGMAVQFGFPVASIFLQSYNKSISKTDNNFVTSMIGLSKATVDALAVAGVLDSTFSVMKINQLAIALVAKYSSLIATSLETREWSSKPKWAQLYDPDMCYSQFLQYTV